MLVNTARLTDAAKEGHYAVTGFCPMDIEQLSWCFEVSSKMRSPMIVCGGATGGYTLEQYANFVKYYANKFPEVPCALCLDHAPNYEQCARAIKAGFTSVMIDLSMYDKETNIKGSKEVVDLAHICDVGVETSIGGTSWRDPSPEEILAHMTKVEDMKDLVEGTGCDMVAVYVGGAHGDHRQDQVTILHYDLIEELRDCSDAALVMHGSSNTGDEKLAQAAKSGISKFNAAGDMLIGGIEEYGKVADTEDGGVGFEAIKRGFMKRAADYITFFGSANKY